jgi:two-component system, chemotaxis family, chemotaxis protein CheY
MAASIVGKDRTALVVDDVIEMRAILIHMLRTLGFVDIKEAGSGKSAMRMLEDDNGFDLMILDQKMADMDGLSVVRWMRTEWQGTKKPHVIMVTGHTDKKSVLTALELGVAGFLAKPVSRVQLEAKITACLAKAA